VGDPAAIDGSWPGRAFTTDTRIEEELRDGSRRLYLPMLDGSARIGVLALTLSAVDDNDRRLAQRLAGLTADLIVTKSDYTSTFDRVRTDAPMSLSAHLQWQTLPPLNLTTPDLALAGILEPAYDVGGDSFDYALDEHVLHLAVFDAMGHGMEAATMATIMVATYRHGRRSGASLPDLYVHMDDVLAATYPGRFTTAQVGRLDTETGVLSWVNAGHPGALRIRPTGEVRELGGPISRPLGFGGATPRVHSARLTPGDRVLFFTDGVVEERLADGGQFGEARLRELVERTSYQQVSVPETVRLLSHALMDARGGRTSDDASLVLVEWGGPPRDDELARGIVGGLPPGNIS
jgi:serine phosphatase RsbU (regulator of sigma subunit)